MKQYNINALIVKYYEGTLPIVEEEYLINYLKDNDEPQFADIKLQISVMAGFFDDEKMLDDTFDINILEKLGESESTNAKRFNISRIFSGIAATALILISIWFASNIINPKEVYGTINDPKVAFSYTKKALQKVSGNVKKGVMPAAKSMKKVEKSLDNTGKITKATDALKEVQKINKLNEAGKLLKSMTKVTVKYGKS